MSNWHKLNQGMWVHDARQEYVSLRAQDSSQKMFKAMKGIYQYSAFGIAYPISKRWQTLANAKADALNYMKKHPNG